MKRHVLALALIASLAAFQSCTHSPATPAAPVDKVEKPHYLLTQIYLKDGALDPATALSPPPAPGSPADRADYDELLYDQKTRSPRQCQRAESEVLPNLENFFGPKYGPLTEEQVAQWKDFFDGAVRSDTDYWIHAVKKHWKRLRPYIADPQIIPCIDKEGHNPAYPSGHATIAEVYARILEKIEPAKKATIEARVRQIAHDRVLGGVHHPTDVLNGRKLGREIYRAFMKSPAFRAALAALPGTSTR